MATVSFSGTIVQITKELELNGGFKCRYLVVHEPNKTNDKYSNDYQIQVLTDKYTLIDKFKVGAMVRVSANCMGVKYVRDGKNKYFTTLKLWKLDLDGAEATEYEPGYNNSEPEEGEDPPF